MMSGPPIFIVGAGRSGTTLLYEMLRGHPTLAWISNVSERFPAHAWAAAANRFMPAGPSIDRRLALRPTEGYPAFDWVSPEFIGTDSPPLRARDLTPAARYRLHKLAESHVHGMGRDRFLNKNTRNTRRIPYLAAAFPEARFIHVLRHPYAVIASLLKVGFWEGLASWSTPHEVPAHPEYETVAAATLWRDEVQIARNSTKQSQAYEVRYEQIVREPRRVLRNICDFANLGPSRIFYNHCSLFHIQDQGKPVSERLVASQRDAVRSIVRPLAHELDYIL